MLTGMATIEITAEPVKSIDVKLVGVEYTIKPPKGSLAIVLAKKMQASQEDPDGLMRALGDWLTVGFGKAESKAILKRLEDPEDALDLVHIMSLMEKVSEAATGNPTT